MRRRLLRIFAYGLLTVIALVVAAAIVVESEWFKDRVRRFAVNWSAQYLNGQLSIGRLGGSLLRGVTLEDVSVFQDGRDLVRRANITIRYDPFVLMRRQVAFADITISNAHLEIVEDRDGWNVARLLRPRSSTGAPVDFSIARIRLVDGDVAVRPQGAVARHVTSAAIEGRLVRHGGHLAVTIDQLQGFEERSGFHVTHLAGSFTDALEALDMQFAAESDTARVAGWIGSEPVSAGRRLKVRADATTLDVSRLVEDERFASVVTGHATAVIDLRPAPALTSIAFTFKGPHAAGYGYEGQDLDVTGRWSNGRLTFDARGAGYGARAAIKATWKASRFSGTGTFRDVNMTRLPRTLAIPAFASRLAGRFAVTWEPSDWNADVTLEGSTIEDADLSAGTVGHIDVRRGEVRYSARGELTGFNVRRIARPLNLPTFAADRFESRLSGAFHADGTWTSGQERSLEAGASLRDSTLADTHVDALEVTAALKGQQLEIGATGDFEKLTALTAGLPEKVTLEANGNADVRATFQDLSAPITIDAVQVMGRVELLQSTVQGLALHRAVMNGSLAGGMVNVTEFVAEAEGTTVTATGTLALGSDGESALSAKVATDDLRSVGQYLNRPIAGAADIDVTVSGPADHPQAKGTLNARQLAYGESATALTLTGSFSADLPDQDLSQLTVQSETNGTFLKVGNVELVTWSGNVGYRNRELDLETHFEQQAREVDLAGVVSLETETRQIAIRRLAMRSGDALWTLPEGREARVAIDPDRVHVDGLVLARAEQEIKVSGTLAFAESPDQADEPDTLLIDAKQIQIADINQMLLGTRKLTGVASGTIAVTGHAKAPVVDARMSVTNGSVQDVPFDAVRASVQYADGLATIDAALDQTAANRLAVAGTLPVRVEEGRPPSSMDLRVTSTSIDLGMIQAFTSELNNVTGTGQFNLQVTGTRQAPSVNGKVVLAGGAFDVAATGVRYQDLNADLQFKDQHLQIDALRLVDTHRHALQVTGGLDVLGERAGQALDVRLTADDVQVLNNRSGHVEVDGDIEVRGDLHAPSIAGSLRIDQGRIEVDQVLETFTKNVYSTTPQVEEDPAEAGEVESLPAQGATPGSFYDRLAVTLELEVPDNLVIRGQDLRVGGSSLGLGDTNIVTGGAVALRKTPGSPISIVGSLEVVRGYYAFQGRRFDLERESTVRFRGESLDPEINFTGHRLISGVETSVHVQGSARRPSVTLSSRPPLETADILALIVFGQPANDLGMSQRVSLAERAAAMAAGAVTTPLSASVARALNLDLFEIQAPTGDSKAAAVAAGAQIGSRLYIGVRQEIGYDESSTLSVEYRLAEVMRVVTSVAQAAHQARTLGRNEAGGVDLYFVFRY